MGGGEEAGADGDGAGAGDGDDSAGSKNGDQPWGLASLAAQQKELYMRMAADDPTSP